jgi:hypothetical protein
MLSHLVMLNANVIIPCLQTAFLASVQECRAISLLRGQINSLYRFNVPERGEALLRMQLFDFSSQLCLNFFTLLYIFV